MDRGGGGPDPAIQQGQLERTAESFGVEPAFGVRAEVQSANDVVGFQWSPLTSARGEGAALSGARQGRRWAMRVQ